MISADSAGIAARSEKRDAGPKKWFFMRIPKQEWGTSGSRRRERINDIYSI